MIVEGAIRAALAVAAEHGLRGVEPVLLSNRANVLLHLAPAPVVVRVATTTALVRPAVADTLAKDVALAGYLAEQGAPVVAPSPDLPPGPHHRDGFALTFWTYVAHDPDRRIAPAEVGVLLDELHAVLRGYPGVLPGVPPLDVPEITRYLRTRAHDPAALAELDLAGERVLRAMAESPDPVQPLHGDAHGGNLLHTPRGPLWTDFEDAWCGPIGWDLACLLRSSRLAGEAALAGYPDLPDLATCLAARDVLMVSWSVLMAERFPERRPRPAELLDSWLSASRTG